MIEKYINKFILFYDSSIGFYFMFAMYKQLLKDVALRKTHQWNK